MKKSLKVRFNKFITHSNLSDQYLKATSGGAKITIPYKK
ncbi:hypothetical protein PCARR_b0597 [Pseudoalteromonas carrageenovora IAM 12662]|uniref:Uncharacterized protein n=1 Tax=Pseudoalteromonas carrageenovora IAM 12662 TaxID=1314868 RepID=A0A2K4XF75_PSEVC|nr:hypothetical protein [Pseudoalteromonas carrageenovora IAM 12662]SOU42976.1 protein of unknown function [Pseudoalteromonas carrageenovora IAM 12662]